MKQSFSVYDLLVGGDKKVLFILLISHFFLGLLDYVAYHLNEKEQEHNYLSVSTIDYIIIFIKSI